MIIYSVTVKIDKKVESEWLNYMKNQHIGDVMATGCFKEYKFAKLLMEDPDGTNYSIQYLCESLEVLQGYQSNHAPALQQEHTEKFKDQFVAFRSLLEVVDQSK